MTQLYFMGYVLTTKLGSRPSLLQALLLVPCGVDGMNRVKGHENGSRDDGFSDSRSHGSAVPRLRALNDVDSNKHKRRSFSDARTIRLVLIFQINHVWSMAHIDRRLRRPRPREIVKPHHYSALLPLLSGLVKESQMQFVAVSIAMMLVRVGVLVQSARDPVSAMAIKTWL